MCCVALSLNFSCTCRHCVLQTYILCALIHSILVQCHAFWASGSDPTGCGQKVACLAVCFMTVTVDRTRHSINCLQHSVVVVSRGDVHTESGSAAVDTVQAQGWSVVARKQAFAELRKVC